MHKPGAILATVVFLLHPVSPSSTPTPTGDILPNQAQAGSWKWTGEPYIVFFTLVAISLNYFKEVHYSIPQFESEIPLSSNDFCFLTENTHIYRS